MDMIKSMNSRVMILMNDRNLALLQSLLNGTLYDMKVLMIYLVRCAVFLVLLRWLVQIPNYVFRKMLHVVAFSCVAIMICFSEDWIYAALACIIVAGVIYPVLVILEKEDWYSGLFVEKRPGEVKSSLLQLFLTMTAVIAVSWGFAGEKRMAVAAVLMWGLGDAAAALIGIPFGRHKITWRFADQNKSYEGTLAMFVVSFLAGLFILRDPGVCLAAAAAAALSELVSRRGTDTVFVPLAVTAVLCLLL